MLRLSRVFDTSKGTPSKGTPSTSSFADTRQARKLEPDIPQLSFAHTQVEVGRVGGGRHRTGGGVWASAVLHLGTWASRPFPSELVLGCG